MDTQIKLSASIIYHKFVAYENHVRVSNAAFTFEMDNADRHFVLPSMWVSHILLTCLRKWRWVGVYDISFFGLPPKSMGACHV